MSENTVAAEIVSSEIAVADTATDASIFEPGNSIEAAIQSMKENNVPVFSTLEGDDFATKLTVANAVSSAAAVSDNLGRVFKLENFIIQPIDMADEGTGNIVTVPRIILLGSEGEAFYAISQSILSSLQTLCAVMKGMPATWSEPVPVKVVEVKTRKGFKAFSLEAVVEKKSAK